MNTSLDYKAAITQIQKLHPTAAVFARAHQLITSHSAQLADIINVVKLDPALTADIIRLSNSGAYGRVMPAGDLDTAVHRVGLREVDMFLGLSFSKNVINQNLQCYGITAYDYWAGSVAVAFLMELLAKRMAQDTSEAYTLGILHATGRLVINQVLDDLRMTIYWDGTVPIESWEMESVGFTYATAGALLLKEWGFPDSFCEIIENQTFPGRVAHPSTMMRTLNFSLRLLLCTGVAFTIKNWTFPETDPFLKEFGITQGELRELVETVQKRQAEAQVSLGIPQ